MHKSLFFRLFRRPLLLLAITLWLGSCQSAPADQAMATQVLLHINSEPALQASQIRVQVIGGVVYLYGLVDTEREMFAVEAAARTTPGVIHVVNATSVHSSIF
jgi:osmotically-inducible protein OsmY